MGCNCGKGRTRPAGFGSTAKSQDTKDGGKGKEDTDGQTQKFTLDVGGKTQTFGSRLERDAAARRLGTY